MWVLGPLIVLAFLAYIASWLIVLGVAGPTRDKPGAPLTRRKRVVVATAEVVLILGAVFALLHLFADVVEFFS